MSQCLIDLNRERGMGDFMLGNSKEPPTGRFVNNEDPAEAEELVKMVE